MKSLVLFLVLSFPVFAQSQPQPKIEPRPLTGFVGPESPNQRFIDGFGGLLLIVKDPDWKAKWDTPSSTIPQFNTTNKVKRGEAVTFLFLFTNPLPDAQGAVDVTCDIRLTNPDGKMSEYKNVKGLKGRLNGPVGNTYRAEPVIDFKVEATDPLGEYLIEVTLNDLVRKVSVPLSAKLTASEK